MLEAQPEGDGLRGLSVSTKRLKNEGPKKEDKQADGLAPTFNPYGTAK